MENIVTTKYDVAVVNGRFSIPHIGHLECVRKGLEIANRVVVIIGSANAYPSSENPFTAEEREEMLKTALYAYVDKAVLQGSVPHSPRSRISYQHVDDSLYQNMRWQSDIRDSVGADGGSVAMVGFKKDANSWWLDTFGWDVVEIEGAKHHDQVVSATRLRKHFFEDLVILNSFSIYKECVMECTIHKLEYFRKFHSRFKRLKAEHDYKVKELKKLESYPYRKSLNCCTADSLVVCNGHLLTVTRGGPVGNGAFAFPGGHKDEDETFVECAIRELHEEVKLKVPVKVLYGSIVRKELFDAPTRSYLSKPTLAVLMEIQPDADGSLPKVQVKSEILDVKWMSIDEVRKNKNYWFEDHYSIIKVMLGL
jgi:bifunctional NMN adenylyltransferase/nudix hydrolase